MSYRKAANQAREWKEFLQRFPSPLLGAGVPEVALRSERDWHYFLEHGYHFDGLESSNVENLRAELQLRLCLLLEDFDSKKLYVGVLLERLQYLCGRGSHRV